VLARREQDDPGLRARIDVARKLSQQMARDWQPLFAQLEARGEGVACCRSSRTPRAVCCA
jgi:hypothetical protein